MSFAFPKSNTKTKFNTKTLYWIIPIVILALFPVIGLPPKFMLYLFIYFVYLALANMWNLLSGYSGLLLLCPAAFIGISGYTLVLGTWVGIPMFLGIIVGGVVAALFALVIAAPVFRLRGIYFAIGTLVVPEALKYLFFMWRPIGGQMHGGGAGYAIQGAFIVSSSVLYWIALGIGLLSVFAINQILKSKLGLGLAGIRDNDAAAASNGVDVFRLKLTAFIIAAFGMGITGGLYYLYTGCIEPVSAFNLRWLMIPLLATVIGGVGIQAGPMVGTIIVVILQFLLARYAGISLLIQGVILVIIMALAPEGILGIIRRKTIRRPWLRLAKKKISSA
jgi:branched-chain amino acid transport system permease protein